MGRTRSLGRSYDRGDEYRDNRSYRRDDRRDTWQDQRYNGPKHRGGNPNNNKPNPNNGGNDTTSVSRVSDTIKRESEKLRVLQATQPMVIGIEGVLVSKESNSFEFRIISLEQGVFLIPLVAAQPSPVAPINSVLQRLQDREKANGHEG